MGIVHHIIEYAMRVLVAFDSQWSLVNRAAQGPGTRRGRKRTSKLATSLFASINSKVSMVATTYLNDIPFL